MSEQIKLPGDWSLRKLSLADRSEWALQYKDMDWIKISDFLQMHPPDDALDNQIRKFAAAMNSNCKEEQQEAQGE
jgi:hypothetical protein